MLPAALMWTLWMSFKGTFWRSFTRYHAQQLSMR